MRSILFERNKSSEDAVTLPLREWSSVWDNKLLEWFDGANKGILRVTL